MTRHKKSRKPGRGSSGIVKQDNAVEFDKDKRIRKKKGNKAGSRQQVNDDKRSNQQGATNKDPRVGSTKPIALVKVSSTKTVKPKAVKPSAMPKIVAVNQPEVDLSALWQALDEIEQHPELQAILEKMDLEQGLSEEEVTLYNELMARHQKISEQLGINDEEGEADDEQSSSTQSLSEDDLWNKFNDDKFDIE